jgi:hypothetical protein
MPKSKHTKRSNSKSGYCGVVKVPSGRYQALIWIDSKTKSIGTYYTAKQAAKAYDKEAIRLRRPFSKLNYPKKAPVGYTPIQQTLRSDNTVGYRGVAKKGKKYRADITIVGKITYIGTYDTAKEAAIAFDRAVLKVNKSTSLLNFPDMVHNLDVEPKRKKLKPLSTNTTGYRGVCKRGKRFQANIYMNNKQIQVGKFDTAIGAALAYDQAAIKAGKPNHTLNFPDGLPIKQESDIDESEGFWV